MMAALLTLLPPGVLFRSLDVRPAMVAQSFRCISSNKARSLRHAAGVMILGRTNQLEPVNGNEPFRSPSNLRRTMYFQ
jgi:hypothetical protein